VLYDAPPSQKTRKIRNCIEWHKDCSLSKDARYAVGFESLFSREVESIERTFCDNCVDERLGWRTSGSKYSGR